MNPNYGQGYYQQPYGYRPPPPVPPQPKVSTAASAIKITIGILAPLLWFIALALPAYNEKVYGIFCLVMGWSMIFTGNILAFFAWFSNLPFIISFFLFVIGNGRKGKIAAIVLAGVSLALSFGALTVTKVVGNDGGNVFDNDDFMKTAYPSYGMFVWMGAYLILLIGAIVFIYLRNSDAVETPAAGIPLMPENQNPYPPFDPYTEYTMQYPPELPGEHGENPWEDQENNE